MFVAGQFLTPGLLKAMSARTFTTVTNLTNLLGFFMRGWSENPKIFWAAIVPMLPGVNGSSASAIKAIASDHARAAGLGAGEMCVQSERICTRLVAVALGRDRANVRHHAQHQQSGAPHDAWVGADAELLAAAVGKGGEPARRCRGAQTRVPAGLGQFATRRAAPACPANLAARLVRSHRPEFAVREP